MSLPTFPGGGTSTPEILEELRDAWPVSVVQTGTLWAKGGNEFYNNYFDQLPAPATEFRVSYLREVGSSTQLKIELVYTQLDPNIPVVPTGGRHDPSRVIEVWDSETDGVKYATEDAGWEVWTGTFSLAALDTLDGHTRDWSGHHFYLRPVWRFSDPNQHQGLKISCSTVVGGGLH